MLDDESALLLTQVRDTITAVYDSSSDLDTRGCWIPQQNIIPTSDLHVTVATPWWWHSLPDGDEHKEVSISASQFR